MIVSNCQNWHISHAEDTDVETLGEPDARKRASRGSEGRGWCPWVTRAWLLTLPKVKQNAAQRKAGKTKKRYKGLDKAPKYVSPTLTYNYHRDYSLKPAQQVSILTLQGRMIVAYTGY